MLITRAEIDTAAPPSASLPDAGAATPEQRQAARQGVLWAAKLEVAGTVLDCIVLDMSVRGARIRFASPVALPDRAVLKLRDGTRYEARRCWSRGTQSGLEFLSPGAAFSTGEHAALRARTVLEKVHATDPAQWLPALRAERYFGDEALRQAAEAAEVAHMRLLAALRPHVPGA